MLISQPRPSLVTKSRQSACAPCVSTVINPGKAHAPLALLSKAESWKTSYYWNQSLVTVGCAFQELSTRVKCEFEKFVSINLCDYETGWNLRRLIGRGDEGVEFK